MTRPDAQIFTFKFDADISVLKALFHSYAGSLRLGVNILSPIMAVPGSSGLTADYYGREELAAAERANLQAVDADRFAEMREIELPVRKTVVVERSIYRVAGLQGQYADLNIVCLPSLNDLAGDSVDRLIEALVFESGRPLLLQPTSARADHRHAAFAWSGRREGVVAIAGAMATLPHLERITLVNIDGELPSVPEGIDLLAGMQSYLDRRFQNIDLYAQPKAGRTGDALQDAALAVDADILVMGAYGHSRMRQTILGGATRSILAEPRLPLLLAH